MKKSLLLLLVVLLLAVFMMAGCGGQPVPDEVAHDEPEVTEEPGDDMDDEEPWQPPEPTVKTVDVRLAVSDDTEKTSSGILRFGKKDGLMVSGPGL